VDDLAQRGRVLQANDGDDAHVFDRFNDLLT
jgi:hypothetical protein